MSEQQLLHILQGNRMAQTLRTEREMRPVPRLLAHTYPISVGSSNSARPTDTVTRVSPDASRSTLDRVMETIYLSAAVRAARRDERQAISNVLLPDVPMTASIVGNQESHQNEGEPPSFTKAWTMSAVFVKKDFDMTNVFAVSHVDTCSTQGVGRARKTTMYLPQDRHG